MRLRTSRLPRARFLSTDYAVVRGLSVNERRPAPAVKSADDPVLVPAAIAASRLSAYTAAHERPAGRWVHRTGRARRHFGMERRVRAAVRMVARRGDRHALAFPEPGAHPR